MSNALADIGKALGNVANLIADDGVLLAITSHLTAREVIVIADLFEAAGDHATYRKILEGIIHGEDEVRAVAGRDDAETGTIRVEYFKEFLDCGVDQESFHARAFPCADMRAVMRELGLVVDTDHREWADTTIPGRLVLDSEFRS